MSVPIPGTPLPINDPAWRPNEPGRMNGEPWLLPLRKEERPTRMLSLYQGELTRDAAAEPVVVRRSWKPRWFETLGDLSSL